MIVDNADRIKNGPVNWITSIDEFIETMDVYDND